MSPRLPESPSGVVRWLRILLAAAFVLLAPLALSPTWAETPRPGILDDDRDIDDDVCEIKVDHAISIAEDRAPAVAAPAPRLIARSQPVTGPVVTVWHGCAADERAPPCA